MGLDDPNPGHCRPVRTVAADTTTLRPQVYCLESVDNPGHRLDDITIDPTAAIEVVSGDGVLAGLTTLRAAGHLRARTGSSSWWPYRRANTAATAASEAVTLTAVPYYTWGNRTQGAMRIWVPTD